MERICALNSLTIDCKSIMVRLNQISKVGMTLVIDHSGRVHSKKRPTLKDVVANREATTCENGKGFQHVSTRMLVLLW